ncbi:MAG: hypothetical protein EYC69_05355 [Bacteroidetes bacterium]|nr:MAG: hypothetical protein EYC69_05355 [Bacteroidota bacterium]
MTVLKNEASVIGVKAFPAISILLPTHTPEAGINTFRDRVAQIVRKVEAQLSENYSSEKTAGLMSKLHHAVNGIDLKSTGAGIAIYISDKIEKVFHLPFAVTEKMVIDNSFEVRDLLYAAKINRSYLLVLISRNEVKTLLGYGKSLVSVEMEGMPDNVKDVTTQHSLPGWDYLDKQAYDESNINKFIHFIDSVIHEEMKELNMPIIVFGDSKILGYFKKKSKNLKNILDYIEGNYERAAKHEILKLIENSLQKLIEQEEKNALVELEQASGKNQISAGIAQVWRTAAEARGRTLLVEKDYKESARLGSDGYTLIVDNGVSEARNKIEDAVDDIIEMVLKNRGDVVFLNNGALKAYQHIVMLNRY